MGITPIHKYCTLTLPAWILIVILLLYIRLVPQWWCCSMVYCIAWVGAQWFRLPSSMGSQAIVCWQSGSCAQWPGVAPSRVRLLLVVGLGLWNPVAVLWGWSWHYCAKLHLMHKELHAYKECSLSTLSILPFWPTYFNDPSCCASQLQQKSWYSWVIWQRSHRAPG